MSKFKVGDRVIGICYDVVDITNQTGFVIGTRGTKFFVEFDNKFDKFLHTKSNIADKTGKCLYVGKRSIKLVVEEMEDDDSMFEEDFEE